MEPRKMFKRLTDQETWIELPTMANRRTGAAVARAKVTPGILMQFEYCLANSLEMY